MELLFQLLLALLAGTFFGIITGLTPGVHINLVSVILITLSPFFLHYTTAVVLASFIIAMGITHSFLDFIPGIFLGAPDADTALAILPGHKMLLEGDAYNAVKLTVIGSLGSLLFAVLLMPLLYIIFPLIFTSLKKYIGILLILIMAYMILKDKNRIWNFFIFMLSGILGMIVLSMNNLNEPLFPLLSGLFGTSMLLMSLKDKINIPAQKVKDDLTLDKKVTAKAITGSTIAGSLTAFFPGLGAAQGAVLAQQFLKNIGDKGFMVLVGGINTVNFVVCLITLTTISKARNGAVIAVQRLLESTTLKELVLFAVIALLAGCLATYLALSITKGFAKIIVKVNYKLMAISVIGLIAILAFVLGGMLGVFILMVSTALGVLPALLGVGRNHAMGCLILPVIFYFVL